MYQVPPPKEPNGCLQTAVISRMIAQILFVPMLLIFGGVLCVIFAVYAFAANTFLGIAVILVTIVVLTALSMWEYRRVKRGLPPLPEDPPDPRLR